MYLKLTQLSLKALRENRLRTILTTLGIIIGTAIIIIVLSVGAGIQNLILEQLSSITSETLWIEIQVPSSLEGTAKDTNTATSITSGVQITTMKIKDVEDLKKLDNVKDGYGMIMGQAKFTAGSNEKRVLIWAVESSYAKIEGIKMEAGRFFNVDEDRSFEKVLVLGSDVKNTLFGASNAVGQKVKVNGQSYKVIGIAGEIGTKYFMNMDEIIYIPVQTTQKYINGLDYLQAIALEMKDADKIYVTMKQVGQIMRKNHNIKDPKDDDFAIRTMQESMDIINAVTGGINILLFFVAFISLVVGGVGIMNVMYVAVTERTKEIGLLKAVGAKPKFIRFQFILEAVIISLLGSILGLSAGIITSGLISIIATALGFNWPLILNFSQLIFAFSIAIFLGVTFGYAPANKAAKMDPIEALRRN